MMIGIFCLAASTLLLAGIILGLLWNPAAKDLRRKSVPKTREGSLEDLNEDFRNLLSYDGSEQL